MALRSDNVPSTTLTQVGAESNPRSSEALTVSGTLDGNAYLKVEIPKTSVRVVDGAAIPV